jgi:hypothetical protein
MSVIIIQRLCSDAVAAQRRYIPKCTFLLPRGEKKLVLRIFSLKFISHIFYHQSFATIGLQKINAASSWLFKKYLSVNYLLNQMR